MGVLDTRTPFDDNGERECVKVNNAKSETIRVSSLADFAAEDKAGSAVMKS